MIELTFLGTGTSSGVPVLGCKCGVCTSNDPRDTRLRTSAYVWTEKGTGVLLDVGPDFRYQALKYNVTHIDGVLITHAHQDHIGGIDELRQVNFIMRKELDVYGNAVALDEVRRRFDYIFKPTQEGGGKPRIRMNEVKGKFRVNEISVLPVPVQHGDIPILGYRIGGLSYITDANFISGESMELLKGTDVLVINALRPEPHPTHFSLEQALETAGKIGPRQTFLVHMTHHFKHEKDGKELPGNIHFAHDGLKIQIG